MPLTVLYATANGNLPSSSYGWGWYAVPLAVGGVLLVYSILSKNQNQSLYIAGWLITVHSFILPFYLEELESGRSFYERQVGLLFLPKAEITILYIAGTLLLLIVPLWLGRIYPKTESQKFVGQKY